MKKFIMMVGLPGSGKSTLSFCYTLLLENTVIVSSDNIREEFNLRPYIPEHTAKAFKIVKERILENLENDKTVVFDATNLNSKKRINFLKEIKDFLRKKSKLNEYEFCAHVLSTPIEVCEKRIEERNDKAINKMPVSRVKELVSLFEIPYYEEGFDEITIEKSMWMYPEEENEKVWEMMKKLDFDQNSKYHNETALKHSYIVYDGCQSGDFPIPLVGMYHDLGKAYVKQDKPDGTNSYIGHASWSTYLLLNFENIFGRYEKLDFLFYINYHMYPSNWVSEKSHKKAKEKFGEEKYKNLLKFHEIDKRRF